MSRQHHYLKTETEYYEAVKNGNKSFELRKNDRGFQVGDIVSLVEVINGKPTCEQRHPMEIIYILHGGKFGLKKGYCILQLS